MMHDTAVTTIERFILDQERLHPQATGELSDILYDICLAAKVTGVPTLGAFQAGLFGFRSASFRLQLASSCSVLRQPDSHHESGGL